MRRSDARILTTHVGSLVRPAELLEQSKASRESAEEPRRYEEALRCATRDVVAQQVDAGIDIIKDIGDVWHHDGRASASRCRSDHRGMRIICPFRDTKYISHTER